MLTYAEKQKSIFTNGRPRDPRTEASGSPTTGPDPSSDPGRPPRDSAARAEGHGPTVWGQDRLARPPASPAPIPDACDPMYRRRERRPVQCSPLTEEVRRTARKSFVSGVYQRQSPVVDPGTVPPRGRRLGTFPQTCRRCAPPVTSVRPTSFASQRTQASFTFRIRGFGWSRCKQHGTSMFASPRDARERNGRQMHGNGARRYGEGRAWSPRRFYGPLARASRGWWHGGKVIGGGVMRHHATPNHFLLARPSSRICHEP